ncbi:piggyBac transposable element-derived protein 4-like [Tenebrio molitor]|uniref:piggyBac transposable element-derived protein 4-like n=1 Tax=Tenebrio molitor TaxID=7067 RepID=UPI0036248C23
MVDTVDFSGDSGSDPESDNDILFETLSESDYSDLEDNKATPVIPPGTLDPLSSPQTPDPCSRDSNPLPGPHYLSFLSSPELQQTPTTDGQIHFFRLIFDDEMCDFIVNQTNAYADSLQRRASSSARINRWKPLTRNEFLVFLGLLFHTGTVKLPSLMEYWSTDSYFEGMMSVSWFPKNMSRHRFFLILRCLHFAPNPTDAPKDALYKIRPLLDFFHCKIDEVFAIGGDEAMVLWRGHLRLRQYTQTKHQNYGLKLYMLTEPSGVVRKFLVHAASPDTNLDHAQLVEDKTHSLYVDNMDSLFKWKYKKEVVTISTESSADLLEQLNRRDRSTHVYNNSSCDINRVDELLSYYPCEGKSVKWYKKLAIHIFHLVLINSYHLYNMNRRPKQTLHFFRLNLILSLSKHTYEYRPRQMNVLFPATGHYP